MRTDRHLVCSTFDEPLPDPHPLFQKRPTLPSSIVCRAHVIPRYPPQAARQLPLAFEEQLLLRATVIAMPRASHVPTAQSHAQHSPIHYRLCESWACLSSRGCCAWHNDESCAGRAGSSGALWYDGKVSHVCMSRVLTSTYGLL